MEVVEWLCWKWLGGCAESNTPLGLHINHIIILDPTLPNIYTTKIFLLGFWGWGTDPEAMYNLCMILKIML
jgi:hypothetical protein